MNEIAVSVIIPVYNVEKYLSGCIDSLLCQTLKNIEIILINDGSIDNSLEIATQYQRQYSNIIVITKGNTGVADSRNEGLRLAQGEYIYFLDSDDFILCDTLKSLYNIAKTQNLDMVMFNSMNVSDDTQVAQSINEISEVQKLGGLYLTRDLEKEFIMSGRDFVKHSFLATCFYPVVWLSLYRREFLINNHFQFEKILHEDNIFCIDTTLAALRVSYIDRIFHIRRVVNNSITNQQKTEKHASGIIRVLHHASDLYDRHKSDNMLLPAILAWCKLNVAIANSDISGCDKVTKDKYKKEYLVFLLQHLHMCTIGQLVKAIVI